jgi:hypothetical protein
VRVCRAAPIKSNVDVMSIPIKKENEIFFVEKAGFWVKIVTKTEPRPMQARDTNNTSPMFIIGKRIIAKSCLW